MQYTASAMDSQPSSSSRASYRPLHMSTPPRALGSRNSSRTALQGSHHNIEPPSTPPNQKSKQKQSRGGCSARVGFDKGKSPATDATSTATASASASTARQQADRQTFLDNDVSVPPIEENLIDQSDHSRGQSWSSVTRDSVVDNLLSSFDRMPGQDVLSFDTVAGPLTGAAAIYPGLDNFDYAASPPRTSQRIPQRPRGHTYSSSLSTDMASVDDGASFYSRNLSSRGKRSNSSSNFMESPARLRDGRDGKPALLSRSSSETQRTARNNLQSRGSAKKGSAGSSFDYGYQIVSTAQLKGAACAPIVSRSPSRENVFTQSDPDIRSNSILGRGRPVPSLFSKYEICPEPAVPGGPRRRLGSSGQSSSRSSLTALPQTHASMSRLNELSPLSQAHDAPAPPNNIPQAIRDQASEFVRASNMRTGSQSSRPDQPRSFSPASSRRANAPSAEPVQQRPGFFRRVFGSSNNRSSTAAELDQQLSRESSTALDHSHSSRKKSLPNPTTQVSSQIRPDSKAAKPPSSSPAPGVVTKKQSFFRRRKKSIAEDIAPPALPTPFFHESVRAEQAQPPSSPSASSLRKVLDQFLVDVDAPTPSGQIPLSRFAADSGGIDNDADSIEIFHSGYTPPPDATLRRNAPLDHRASIGKKTRAAERSEGLLAPKPRTPPDPDKLQVLTMQNENQRPDLLQTGSFLSDPSDGVGLKKSPSIISAISDTYGGLSSDGAFSPVSPMLSPSSDLPPGGAFFANSPLMNADFGPVSPGATIRAVASDLDGPSLDHDYGVKESKGLAIQMPPRTNTDRIWIQSPGSSYEDVTPDSLSLPFEGPILSRPASPAPPSAENGRKDSVPVVEVNGNEIRPSVDITRHVEAVKSTEPTAEDMDRARKIFDGEEEFVSKLQAAAWLGERTSVSGRTLSAYMAFFDWSGQNVLFAMRTFCEKLTLKGESQQVDRILEAFANRWHECNPNNGFKGPSVIHNICYALLLLNTDQHIANIQHKMTRSEFIKNTMPAVKDAAEKTIKSHRQNSRPSIPWQDSNSSVPNSPTLPQAPQDDAEERSSIDFKRSMKRLSIRPGVNRNETDPGPGGDVNNYASNMLINFGYEGSERGWLLEVENVLKSFYNSIVADALPLHGANDRENAAALSPTNNLSVKPSVLRRTGSIISKAPSEGFSYRGRKVSDTQSLAHRWQSKNRPRQKVYPASTVGSSRASFEDGNSMLSPAGSSMWSRISTGRTQPTMSVESFALTHDFKQSLGFTNALSQAIIREETISDSDSFYRVGSLLEDESLELAGAPWAKEGMVKHKHHLEGPEKKAKERSWHECFAVVEKGYLHLFSFNRNPTTKISNVAARARKNTGASKVPSVTPSVVGGGNWTDNAEELGQFLLRQTIATTLPTPGYSKTRPHVWALSLPTGAVHLFQVGTAEIAEEFASTANYWSARLSKEPLVGGIDNIEYGWSDNILNPALTTTSPPPSRGGAQSAMAHHTASDSISTITNPYVPGHRSRPSMQSSLRTSLDQSFSNKPRLPGDRALISDWRPPAASMLPSQLMEIDQLRSLKAYITSIEMELEKHNELRTAIPLAYTDVHGTRLNKVMGNWKKKSDYLLREAVKFRTYIEALERAGVDRERVYEERRVRDEENAAIKGRQMSVAS